MSETPRTDEMVKFVREQLAADDDVSDHAAYTIAVLGSLCRQLEQELAAARKGNEE